MGSLNQQIAEELGWFIGTEEEGAIYVYLCSPEGREIFCYMVPRWDVDGHHDYLVDLWGDLYEYVWSFLPNWEGDLQIALQLATVVPYAPENGPTDPIHWTLQYHIRSGYFVYIENEYAEASAESYNAAEAFCIAWLSVMEQNREYWEMEWEDGNY